MILDLALWFLQDMSACSAPDATDEVWFEYCVGKKAVGTAISISMIKSTVFMM